MVSKLDDRLRSSLNNRIKNDDQEINIYNEFEKVANEIGLSIDDAGGKVTFSGADPVVNSTIPLATGSSIALMLKTVAAAKVLRTRGGEKQDLSLEVSKSVSRLSILFKMKEMLNGYNPDNSDTNLASLMLMFPTKDNRFVIPDNNMPKLRDRMQELIGCNNNLPSVAKAIKNWNSDELETKATDMGLVMGKVRSLEEFMQESVYQDYMKDVPLIEIEKIGESAPEPLSKNPKDPLSGIRALGMMHIVAGPTIGRALACAGADVLNIWKPNETEYDSAYDSSDVGLRSTRINYKDPEGLEEVKELLKGADIFVANRRNKLYEETGLTPEGCAKIRPGIICCETSFAGDRGPWKDRIGYDQVAGAVTGTAVLDGSMAAPVLPVINVVNDALVGWLAAAGVMEALCRRATEGGSYRVHVSLCRASLWLMSMGIFDKDYAKKVAGVKGTKHELIEPETFTAKTKLGYYQGYTDQIKMSGMREAYKYILEPRGANFPVWLDKNGNEPEWQPQNPDKHIQYIDMQKLQLQMYAALKKL